MKKILVTGGRGQLASCIRSASENFGHLEFVYVDLDQLDITDSAAVDTFFNNGTFSYCINCAAYTAVDNAERDKETAQKVNVEGPRNLANACRTNNMILIHISTDFVFNGGQTKFYTEEDPTVPLSVYGATKLKGEQAIEGILKQYFIIRTAWLYSEHGNNFMKTMLRLGNERETLNVVYDQIGTPTYAGDLATVLIRIVSQGLDQFGLYHYSNEGVASWYDFAVAIMEEWGTSCKVLPIKTEAYPLPAKRPNFSVMDKTKIKSIFKIEIPYWKDSLKLCLSILNN